MKTKFLQNVTPCNLVDTHYVYGETSFLHLQHRQMFLVTVSCNSVFHYPLSLLPLLWLISLNLQIVFFLFLSACNLQYYFFFRTALFWVITLPVVVIPYRRFGTTYHSHLQGSNY